MTNIKLTLAYDGSRFSGWQRQHNAPNTIQEFVEKALEEILGEKVDLIGAGRTDAGVHALGQVANFKTGAAIRLEKLPVMLNQILPGDIVVKAALEAPERFHARHHAHSKNYAYKIRNSSVPDPFSRKYRYLVPQKLDCDAMRIAAQLLEGQHDFKSFSAGRTNKSTVKTIHSIQITEQPKEEIHLQFHGDGFLYNMVRILTGTLLEIGMHTREADTVRKALSSADRGLVGFTAPPHGLFLEEVFYPSVER